MVRIDAADMVGKWERLSAREPAEVCRAAGATWDEDRRIYLVDFLTDGLEVAPDELSVSWTEASASRAGGDPKRDLALLVLEYLANARDVPAAGRWISGKKLPGGAFFWRGPHEAPSELIVKRFGHSPAEFLEKARLLGGETVTSKDVPGDAAARFRVLGRIEVIVVLWAADDEFPARASFLFDASISEHLQIDAVFLVALVLALSLMRA